MKDVGRVVIMSTAENIILYGCSGGGAAIDSIAGGEL